MPAYVRSSRETDIPLFDLWFSPQMISSLPYGGPRSTSLSSEVTLATSRSGASQVNFSMLCYDRCLTYRTKLGRAQSSNTSSQTAAILSLLWVSVNLSSPLLLPAVFSFLPSMGAPIPPSKRYSRTRPGLLAVELTGHLTECTTAWHLSTRQPSHMQGSILLMMPCMLDSPYFNLPVY